jgi:hypothetical protein
VASANGRVIGRQATSTQLITCSGGIGGWPSPCGTDIRAPNT